MLSTSGSSSKLCERSSTEREGQVESSLASSAVRRRLLGKEKMKEQQKLK